MDALKSFFRKYAAVPATDAGVTWASATDDALLAWCKCNCEAWDANPDAQPELLPDMKELRREAWRRLHKYESFSEPRIRLNAAWHNICTRIGFGGDEQ